MNGEKAVFMQAYPLLARGSPNGGWDGGQGEERGRSGLETFGGAEMIGQ